MNHFFSQIIVIVIFRREKKIQVIQINFKSIINLNNQIIHLYKQKKETNRKLFEKDGNLLY